MITNNYNSILLWLLLIFICRVLAQLLQAIYPTDFLPPFGAWHSGSLPYPVLLLSQVAIISLFGTIVLKFRRGTVAPKRFWGGAWLSIGAIYFVLMLFRFIAGLTFAPDHPWLGATIPATFHLVLAGFILVYAHYHFKYGK